MKKRQKKFKARNKKRNLSSIQESAVLENKGLETIMMIVKKDHQRTGDREKNQEDSTEEIDDKSL
jgi:replicative DNA helicase